MSMTVTDPQGFSDGSLARRDTLILYLIRKSKNFPSYHKGRSVDSMLCCQRGTDIPS